MDASVLEFIQMCQWDSARFLIISENVFGRLVYYSHLFPLILSLLLGFFIFWKNNNNLAARWLFLTTIILSLWLLSDLVIWATEKPSYTMFFWSMLVLIEPLIYVGMLFFAYALIDGQTPSLKKKLFVFTLLLPTIILLPTNFALTHYDLSNCYREAIEGPLAFYGYFIEIIMSLWILGFGIKRFFQRRLAEDKKKVALVTFGVVFFLLSFAMGNVIGSLLVDWTIGQYGLFGIPVFIALLAYLIVRYKTFNIKLVSAQALVAALWLALMALLFVRTMEVARIVVSLTLILFLVVGILLVRSVLREVRQREQIAKMAEELQRAYAVEKKAKLELEKLDKFKDQFLMTTQHNLRTPLTAMMGYSDLLLSGTFGKQNKKTIEVIGKFQFLTQGMIKMVNDFLNLAQFQLGKSVVMLAKHVPLTPILEDIVSELKFKADNKKVTLNFEKPQGEIFIEADREKLKAALFNVVDNAVKYTQQGSVDIKIEKKAMAQITVADTGIGISKDHMAKLFDNMFERGEEAKKVAPGSGVGLYLSGQIIQAHHGKIWAEAKTTGQGTVFYIHLPLSDS